MFYNRDGGGVIGFACLFIGIGILISTLLKWGWFMIILGIGLISLGLFLLSHN